MQTQLSHRSFTLEPAQLDATARTVPASLSSDTPLEVYPGESEILSHAPTAIDLSRAKEGLPLLFNHDHGQPIGMVESVKNDGHALRGVLRFGASAKAQEVFADVQSGILKNMSVGYRELASEPVEGGRLVTRWEVFEASIVGVPADPSVGIGRSFSYYSEGTNRMTATTTQTPATDARKAIDLAIRSLVKRHHLDEDFANGLIAQNATDEQARSAILDELAARDAAAPTRPRDPRTIEIGYDSSNPELHVRGMAEIIAHRYGGPAPSDQARQFSGMRLMDMARSLLELRGIRTNRLSPKELIERSLHTTSDFPHLLIDAGNRVLRQAYGSYAGGIRRIAKQSTAVDFRAKSKLQLSEAPELKQVNEAGEFTYGSMGEARQSYSLGTYGRIFGITRQAMINDDLGAFADMAARFGRAAYEFENKFLVELFTANPAMEDGVALFHANHSNLAASGSAISIESLGAARKAMRLQKGLDGITPIDATPRYLVVPAALETVAEQYLASLWAGEAAKANPFSGALELVVDPRLDAYSEIAWYVASDPAVIDTIEYSYLESAQGPEIEMRPGFEIDGLEVKVRLDYGAGIIDYRGLYRNPGSSGQG